MDMLSNDDLDVRLAEITGGYGRWTHENGTWTRGEENVPNTRLRRVLQAASDLSPKPLDSCRVLDLGCLDGQYSIEFALHGATVVGVDARESNLRHAQAAKELLRLDRVEFVHEDARSISAERLGRFDIVVCSGLLYHLNTPDVFHLVARMHEMVDHLLIIDTHISLTPDSRESHEGGVYHGHHYVEHGEDDAEEVKADRSLASWGNDTSFVFTRPSLVNLLARVGFSSVYECFNPPHLNYGQPGLEHRNRCAFVAVKATPLRVHTSPGVNGLREDHPEDSLDYTVGRSGKGKGSASLGARLRRKLGRMIRGRR
jgi:SAM-dependent methyltransferase